LDPDVTPEPEKTKPSLKNLVTRLKNLLTPLENLLTPLKNLLTPLKNLPIPKKLVIPASAAAVLLTAGLSAFGLLHAKHATAPQVKAVASAPVGSAPAASAPAGSAKATSAPLGSATATSAPVGSETATSAPAAAATTAPAAAASATVASTTGSSGACSGVVRDIYRQTVAEDPSVTLAEVQSEVVQSGVSCVPDPEIAADLKDLSPACRDMVQYTFLGVREGHTNIQVTDVREKVVEKSVACEHDRRPNIASVAGHKAK
jgi:hypothetical protein